MMNFWLHCGLRLFANNFFSDGGGRYLFGLAPDVVLHADGGIAPVHSSSTLDGLEWSFKNTALYAYYGGVYIGREVTFDPSNQRFVGYGFSGSPDSQNRVIHEPTFGINQTFWKHARYGSANLMVQYAYLQRNPWFVSPGSPSEAHSHMVWVNLRYTLPGSAPTLGK
jgi:hypothetical protein